MIHTFKVRKRARHRIEIFFDKIEPLFTSIDPSPSPGAPNIKKKTAKVRCPVLDFTFAKTPTPSQT
jgi:hypothetical protein